MSENQWIENNRRVIEEFHTNGGRVRRWPPLILLTTTGARIRSNTYQSTHSSS